MNWRAQPPALAGTGCGCFLPDLTRFTRLRCGEARRFTLCRSETPSAVSFSQAVSQALEGVRKVPFFRTHPPPSRRVSRDGFNALRAQAAGRFLLCRHDKSVAERVGFEPTVRD